MPAMPPRALRVLRVLLFGALASTPCAALSQAGPPGQLTVYRCGPQGRELRNTPCPQELGASQVLHYDAEDAQAAAAARERIRQEGLLAERLSREREARARAEREALERAAPGVSIGPKAEPLAAASAPAKAPTQRTARSRHGRHPGKPAGPGRVLPRPDKSP